MDGVSRPVLKMLQTVFRGGFQVLVLLPTCPHPKDSIRVSKTFRYVFQCRNVARLDGIQVADEIRNMTGFFSSIKKGRSSTFCTNMCSLSMYPNVFSLQETGEFFVQSRMARENVRGTVWMGAILLVGLSALMTATLARAGWFVWLWLLSFFLGLVV